MKHKSSSFIAKEFFFGFCKLVLLSSVILCFAFKFIFNDPLCSSPRLLQSQQIKNLEDSTTTNLSHLLFGILGSTKKWPQRRPYIESWWRPNATRGFLLLDMTPDEDLLPWAPSSPPYIVFDNIIEFLKQSRHAASLIQARMVHGMMQAFRAGQHIDPPVRWVVMGDDDTLLLVDNLVEILSKYDHTKYYYFGGVSEFIMANYWLSFDQGYGGAGYILSYSLAEALAKDIDGCLRTHRHLLASDHIIMECIADIGVNLTPLKGIHQTDFHGDISGFLSSHPKTPLLSLHHFDSIDPIFPTMNRSESLNHLMEAAKFDQSRMLQQTICYNRQTNWSVSVSWGYSVHIYEMIWRRSFLQKPIQTFRPWDKLDRLPPTFMFNTRLPSNDSCHAPHVFHLKSVAENVDGGGGGDGIVTTYFRSSDRGLPTCLFHGKHSADGVSQIRVYSPGTKRTQMDRCECCDIIETAATDILTVKYRECLKNEVIA